MVAVANLKTGDTSPLRIRINRDLTGQAVFFSLRRRGTRAIVIDEKPCIIIDASLGDVSYQWLASETAVAGSYVGEFKILEQAEISTAPSRGYLDVEIEQSLGTEPLTVLAFQPSSIAVETERTGTVAVFQTQNGGSPVDVTDQVEWSGRIDPPLATAAAGVITGRASGVGVITATLDGRSANLQVTVAAAPPATGLKLWLSSSNINGLKNSGMAHGDFVGTWKNLGDGGIDPIAPLPNYYSPALRAPVGEPSELEFNGVQNRFDMTDSKTLMGFLHRGLYDIVFVCRRRTAGIDCPPFGSTSTSSDSGIYVAFTATGALQVLLVKGSPGTPVVNHVSTVAAPLGAVEKYLIRADGAQSLIGKGDWSTLQSQAFTAAPGIGAASNDFRVGSYAGTTASEGGIAFFDGDMFELLIYDRNLTAGELAQVQEYLLNTLGI